MAPTPRASATQRKGRAGRLFPGRAFPLYTEEVFDALPAEPEPDVVVEPMGNSVMGLVLAQTNPGVERDVEAYEEAPAEGGGLAPANVFKVDGVDMVTPPPAAALWSGVSAAVISGVLGQARTADGRVSLGVTPAGMRLHTLDPSLSMTLWGLALAAPSYRLRPVDLVTGALSAELFSPFWGARRVPGAPPPRTPPAPPQKLLASLPAPKALLMAGRSPSESVRQVIACEPAEVVVALDAFADAAVASGETHGRLLEWCESAGLNYDSVVDLIKLREAACSSLLGLGLDPFWGEEHALSRGASAAGPGRDPAKGELHSVVDRFSRYRSAMADFWRERLLVWDRGAGAYRLAGTAASQGAPIRPKDVATPHVLIGGKGGAIDPAAWGGEPPRWAVAGSVKISPKKSPSSRTAVHSYEIRVGSVSVVGGIPEDVIYALPAPEEGADSAAPPLLLSLAAADVLLA
jgi:hypothetical protein